jgi:hypothetical protein
VDFVFITRWFSKLENATIFTERLGWVSSILAECSGIHITSNSLFTNHCIIGSYAVRDIWGRGILINDESERICNQP